MEYEKIKKIILKELKENLPEHLSYHSVMHVKDVINAVEEIAVAENQAASTAENIPGLLADFNALLAKLKAAGLMAADTEE